MRPLRRIAASIAAVALVLPFSGGLGAEARAAPGGAASSPEPHPTVPTPRPPSASVPAPSIHVAYVNPSGCVQPGDSRELGGGDFGARADGRSVWLVRTGSEVQLATQTWSPQVISVAVPRSAQLAAGASYEVQLRDAQGVWIGDRGPQLVACGNPAGPPGVGSPGQLPLPDLRVGPSLAARAGSPTPPFPRSSPSVPIPVASAPTPGTSPPTLGASGGAPAGASLLGAATPPPVGRPPPARADVEPREILVLTPDMASARAVADAESASGLALRQRERLDHLGLVLSVLRAPEGADIEEIVTGLRQRHTDAAVFALNHRFGLLGGGRRYAGALIGWGTATPDCGADLQLGLLDTLPDLEHPALRDQNIVAHSLLPAGVAEAPRDHGTAIAALLVGGAASDGFAGLVPGARLYAAGVFRERRTGEIDATTDRLAAGLDWLVGEGVRAVNLSFGGPSNPVFARVIAAALTRGVAVVAAAGNGGPKAAPVYPAAQPGVVAVTAVDALRAPYRDANRGPYVAFAAPGVDVWVAAPGGKGRYVAGTSYAVPFVVAALAVESRTAGAERALEVLTAAAKDLGEPGPDPVFGHGLLRATSSCSVVSRGGSR